MTLYRSRSREGFLLLAIRQLLGKLPAIGRVVWQVKRENGEEEKLIYIDQLTSHRVTDQILRFSDSV
jgi:hypothetical protein